MMGLMAYIFLLMMICGASAQMITNGPMDVAVCSGGSVSIPCGFTGASPLTSLINWRIIRRSDDGSVVSNETLSINDIINNIDDGLMWYPDVTSGGNSAPNSALIVGSLDESHDQSSYQCFLNDDESSIGTLTVFGSPSSVRNLIATVTCLQLSIRTIWDPATGNPLCGDISYDVMLSLSNGTIIMVTSTTNNFYTFSDSTPATDYYVTVAGRNNAGVGESVRIDITSQIVPTPVTNLNVLNVCVTDFTISWDPFNSDPICGPVSYDVRISPSDGVVTTLNATTYWVVKFSNDFARLTSASNFTVTVVAINSYGSGEPAMINVNTPDLSEAVPSGVQNLKNTTITDDRIVISWDAASSLFCGNVLKYYVKISCDNGSLVDEGATKQMNYTFNNLISNTDYIIQVLGNNEAGNGSAIIMIVQTTGPQGTNDNELTDEHDDDDLSTGTVVAITAVVTLVILLVVIVPVTIIITIMCYKQWCEQTEKSNNKNYSTGENSQFVLMGRDVKMDDNPSYAVVDKDTIKMDTNPAYVVTK